MVQDARGGRLPFGAVLILLCGSIPITLALTALIPVLPLIESALAHGESDRVMIRMFVSIIGLSTIIAAPAAGFLIERVGGKRLLLWSSLLMTVAGLLGFVLNDVRVLLVSRFLVGLGAGAFATVAVAFINGATVGRAREKLMGGHMLVSCLFGVGLQPVCGALGQIGWRMPFLVYVIGLPLALIVLVSFPARDPVSLAPPADTARLPIARWFPTGYVLLALVIGSITYLPTIYMPYVMRDLGIFSPRNVAMTGLGYAIASSAMAGIYGYVRPLMTAKTTFALTFATSTAGALTLVTATSYMSVAVGMVLAGMGTGWYMANLMTSTARSAVPGTLGRAIGFVKSAHFVAAPVASLCVEPFVKLYGPRAALVAVSGLAVTMLLVFIVLAVSRAGRPETMELSPA